MWAANGSWRDRQKNSLRENYITRTERKACHQQSAWQRNVAANGCM